MDKIRLLLSLITIAITVGPIAGMLIMYQNNLMGLVVPPEVNKIMNETFATENPVKPPTFVGSQYNATSHTVTLTFQFENPFNFDLTINSLTADIQCATHKFLIGHATLNNPVDIRANETATIAVLVTWTQDAINHFQTDHTGAQSIDIELVVPTVNIQGINVQMNEPIRISNIPIK